jgi:hypothetical protein
MASDQYLASLADMVVRYGFVGLLHFWGSLK